LSNPLTFRKFECIPFFQNSAKQIDFNGTYTVPAQKSNV